MSTPKIHFSTGGGIAECGSSRDTNLFTVVPDEVTCKRCQQTYKYMETVDALTRPEGAAPRFTRPAYAKAKAEPEYPEGSPQYQEWFLKETEAVRQSALKNATRQVVEEVSENEPLYELSYTVVAQRVRQSDLIDIMQTLIAAKAINVKVLQIRG